MVMEKKAMVIAMEKNRHMSVKEQKNKCLQRESNKIELSAKNGCERKKIEEDLKMIEE